MEKLSESPIFLLLTFLSSSLLTWAVIRFKRGTLQEEARKTIANVEQDIQLRRARVEQEIEERHQESKHELDELKRSLNKERQKLKALSDELDIKNRDVSSRLNKIQQQEREVQQRLQQAQSAQDSAQAHFHAIAQLTPEQAQERILFEERQKLSREIEQLKAQYTEQLEKDIELMRNDALNSALERALPLVTKELFSTKRYLKEYEKTAPKLIGKEGRNIHCFESSLPGVSLSFDSADSCVIIASHNSALREIAALAIEQLEAREKITPSITLETIESIKNSFQEKAVEKTHSLIKEMAAEALPLPQEIIRLLADLLHRTSFGQNILLHSIEVASLMKHMSQELGFSGGAETIQIGLLHDIGKALPLSWGRTHAKAGAAFLQSQGFSRHIWHAILSHHGEAEKESIDAQLLVIADRISGGHLGSRHESSSKLAHHSEILAKVETFLQETGWFTSTWASFNAKENHRGGIIEVVVCAQEPSGSLQRELEKKLKDSFKNEKFHVTILLSKNR